ncbi:MAG: stage V sporulation protein AC [Clostridia bacterium]|nr:stage V sporulation protein AC [Clostridia bacterium]MBQ2274457.1 stage V sporulation protein AC [Clostridia bacterium]MBQ5900561.1 stage V sporulation protein AC [Clostridia bacterium]MEE1278866.1 stage V sporulation protein AC [Acutalibacteraceae bacterium]
MNITEQEYKGLVKKASPPSPKLKDFVWAFCVGGFICMLGQLLYELYTYLELTDEVSRMLVPVTLITLSALFTALHIFDDVAKHAGAGTLVPITGFANAVVSPSIEFKTEGWVLGLGANMFKIAGPVIAYGTIASVIYGVIYWITTLF